jgi:hypothetical protein
MAAARPAADAQPVFLRRRVESALAREDVLERPGFTPGTSIRKP